MIQLRAQLHRITALVAGLFVLAMALPRAPLLHHRHGGGARPHVHSELEQLLADALGEHGEQHAHAHRHHRRAAAAAAPAAGSGAAVKRCDAVPDSHCHQQQRFQRALAATVPFLIETTPIGTVSFAPPRYPVRIATLDRFARGPPAPLSHA